ncbi:putative PHD finger domain protein [Aspergillus clavatus NRRL 1]|uniref:Transcription factor BYE1 n=1 Tax=Aspergillus clavatus (strain ATCC 1007 / CBS 513.65 / DSM 816 / NCTC 3887 / NRRL 1 / QM 1276 / 107) TaxID=344612 RepID=A1CTK9_ASPCL|nr:PHD finger domain protein, putative [Aspergillus clavatus NRRL 1]EAW06646.1 PHD finger domain protein, putative [Aspergillus clavatus NRRL 1]
MITETPAKKSKSKGQAKDKSDKSLKPSAEPTPAASEEEEIIRCICGEYEEEEDVERDMICCDQCSAWQHNDCMGLTFAKGEEPDEYFCEMCRPENHRVLLDKIARGEKPWEEAAEKRRQQAEEKKARRKKGRKGGRRGRQSEPRTETDTPARHKTMSVTPAPASVVTPIPEKNGQAPDVQPVSAQKRKFEEHQEASSPVPEPRTKQIKVSPPASTVSRRESEPAPPKEDVDAFPSRERPVVEDLGTLEDISHSARRSAASALIKLFVDQISDAQKQGSFKLPEGKSAKEIAQQLGLSIEKAMYQNICGGSGEPTEAYKLQLRTVLFNVKKNPSLRDRLLVGSLLPDKLSQMSSQDMASEELQQKDAEIKREAERQHIIVQEQGPRIRRTHKGEELIEDENQTVASEPVFSVAPARRSVAEIDGSPSVQSPASPKARQQSEDGPKATRPQSINTQANEARSHAGATIHSPDTADHDHDHVFPEVPTHIREMLPTNRAQADAEIDQLLKDVEPESPPYSPKDYNEEGVIWHGKLIMNPVAEFSSTAKHVGGADLSGRIPWSQLAPSTLVIDGRIDIQLASNYLCGLRFSASTDVSVIAISRPESPRDQAGFDKLFNYFQDRKRFGVVGRHPLPAVKDTYIVPVEVGSSTKPEFLEILENNTLEDTIPERVLLVVFAIKTGESNPPSAQPPSHHPSQEPASIASPLTIAAATPQQHQFLTPGPRHMSQMSPTPPSSFSGPTPSQNPHVQHSQPLQLQHQQQTAPLQSQFQSYQPPEPQQQALPTGTAAAVQLLGAQATAPAIQQLLQIAPNADLTQLGIVRDIILRQPEAASNYEMLMKALYQATTNGHGPQQGAS